MLNYIDMGWWDNPRVAVGWIGVAPSLRIWKYENQAMREEKAIDWSGDGVYRKKVNQIERG